MCLLPIPIFTFGHLLSSSSTLLYMPSSPPFLCQYVPRCACPAVPKGHFEKKSLGMPSPCVHASPCASPPATAHAHAHAPKGSRGVVQDDTDIGLQPAPSWGLSTGVTDSNEQKPTVTASGFWRPGAEELDGDARAHFGGRGVPGAA
jgi:hypothetical protein